MDLTPLKRWMTVDEAAEWIYFMAVKKPLLYRPEYSHRWPGSRKLQFLSGRMKREISLNTARRSTI